MTPPPINPAADPPSNPPASPAPPSAPAPTEVHGDVIHGDQRNITLTGGQYFAGPITAGGDVVLGDQIVNPPALPPTWAEVGQCAQVQSERFFTSQRLCPADLYLPRTTDEAALADFLAGPKAACVLTGPTGSGKTTVISHWAQTLLAAGHAVFIYDCGGSLDLEVDTEVARDLRLKPGLDPDTALAAIGQAAGAAGRQFVLIFDALNEFRSSGQDGPAALLKQLDSLASHLPDAGVRLVLSCNETTWSFLDRGDDLRLNWGRYYPAPQQTLHLDWFTPDELSAAYPLYQQHFHLASSLADLPDALRDQLRSPLVLDLLAEAYQDRPEKITHDALALGVFQRYFDLRVKSLPDQTFVNELAALMLSQKRSSLRMNDMLANDALKADLLSDHSSYRALQEKGILTAAPSGPGHVETVKFTYMQVGAYALARSILQGLDDGADVAAIISNTLLADQRSFPLGWSTARTLITLYALDDPDHKTIAALGQSANPDLRGLVVEGLVQLYADVPDQAAGLIGSLLQMDSADVRRTALTAAYRLGSAARPLFLDAIAKGPPDLLDNVRDALYLIGADDPEFLYSVLDDLAGQISYTSPGDSVKYFSFALGLSITFYINHCDLDVTIQRTSDLWYQILKVRLHADVVLNVSALQPVLARVVSLGYANDLVETLSEVVPPDQLFHLAPDDQARLKRLLPFVDPQTDLGPLGDDLAACLQSGVLLVNLTAAVVLVAHAIHDFAASEPLLRRLFDGLSPAGQLNELVAFSVLLAATPVEWVGMLEDFTLRLFAQQPELVYDRTHGLLARLDLLLLPLGLAYAKRGQGMPAIEKLLSDGLAQPDRRQAGRCLAALGPVGFYQPKAVLAALRAAGLKLDDPALQADLVACLATIRLLHPDDADQFLCLAGAPESLQQQVSAAADVELMSRFIHGLGFYNTTVHQAVFYPRMRRQLLMGSLNALCDATSAQDFIRAYTPVPIQMVREAGYRLIQWTLPE